MDTKFILASVLHEAEKYGVSGDVFAGVRLSGSVNGERGEGYWLLYEESLVLLYRRLGNRDYEGYAAPLEEWTFGEYREEEYNFTVDLSCDGKTYSCVFPPAEQEAAEVILNAIANINAALSASYPESALVMAGLLWILSGDGHADHALRVLGKQLYRVGEKFAEDKELTQIAELANTALNMDQKKSLIANLIEMRMCDGEWSSEEQSALAELAEIWEMPTEDYNNIRDILLLKNQCPLIFC